MNERGGNNLLHSAVSSEKEKGHGSSGLLLAEPKGAGRFVSLGCFGSNFEVCGSSEYAALIELVIVTGSSRLHHPSTILYSCHRRTMNDDRRLGSNS